MGTPQANDAKATLRSVWAAVGRSGEIGWSNWDGVEWDILFEACFMEVYQAKTSKMKLICLCCGADRHSCWFLDMADYIASNPIPVYHATQPAWLFPSLQGIASPGKKVGNYIGNLLPPQRGGKAAFREYAVDDIPDGHNGSACIRPGGCITLTTYMPTETVVQCSGHDVQSVSALFDYVDANRALCIVGALVLANWPSLPWGQHGIGPVPAKLDVLQQSGYVAIGSLDATMDHYFNLHDRSPPNLQRGGTLRPFVHRMFATTIMYYNERVATCAFPKARREQEALLTKLQESVRLTLSFPTPHTTLSEWSEMIRAQWDVDNMHMTTRSKDTNITQATLPASHAKLL